MSNDYFIKKAIFGGFKKEDVIKYIEKIQADHINADGGIRQKDEEIARAYAQTQQLEERLAMQSRKIASLAKLNDEYCEKIHSLEQQAKDLNLRFENIENDCDKLKHVESQIGMLLLDAVLYSDRMTEKAKKVATSISNEARNTIITTADDVSKLSSDIAKISGDFSKDITNLVDKIENLSKSLSSYAKRFDEEEIQSEMDKPYAEQESFAHFFAQYQPDKTTVDISDNNKNEASFGQKESESEFLKSIIEYNKMVEESEQKKSDIVNENNNDVEPIHQNETVSLEYSENETDLPDSIEEYDKGQYVATVSNKEEIPEVEPENSIYPVSDTSQSEWTAPPSDFDEENDDLTNDVIDEKDEDEYDKYILEVKNKKIAPDWNSEDSENSDKTEEASEQSKYLEQNEPLTDHGDEGFSAILETEEQQQQAEETLEAREAGISDIDEPAIQEQDEKSELDEAVIDTNENLKDDNAQPENPIQNKSDESLTWKPEPEHDLQEQDAGLQDDNGDTDNLETVSEKTEDTENIEKEKNIEEGLPEHDALSQRPQTEPNEENSNFEGPKNELRQEDRPETMENGVKENVTEPKHDEQPEGDSLKDSGSFNYSKYEKPLIINNEQINIKNDKIDQLTKVKMIDDKLDFAHPFEKDYAVYQEEKMARSEAEEEFIEGLIYSRNIIKKEADAPKQKEGIKQEEDRGKDENGDEDENEDEKETNNEPAEKALSNEEIEELLRMFPDADDYDPLGN